MILRSHQPQGKLGAKGGCCQFDSVNLAKKIYLCTITIIYINKMTLYYLMPVVFILGILAIALEDVIKVNKAATAVGMCIIMWFLFLLDATNIYQMQPQELVEDLKKIFPAFAEMSVSEQAYKLIGFTITESLGDVSTTLFFVLASMAIIDLIDSHGGFEVITHSIKTHKKRKLLWILSILTFGMSPLLGNLATVIVMIAIARKLIPEKKERLIFSCMIIVAANAGGCWSPIGDVTTLLLWTGGNLTVEHQILHVLPSALAMLLIPLAYLTFTFKKEETVDRPMLRSEDDSYVKIDPMVRKKILIIGMSSLALVPVFQSLFELPPFMGVLFGLAVLWVITDRKYADSLDADMQNLRVSRVFSRIDVSTIFFFLGILMSVQCLNRTGQLTVMADFMNSVFADSEMIALVFGICSSFLDNVALVSASMGMYPIAQTGEFMVDGTFWTFLAYCAVTGGSILIIGSAAGVTVMGLEKISFGYYFKKFTLLVLISYFAGAGVYWLLF